MLISRRALVLSAACLAVTPRLSFAESGPRWYDAGAGLAASGRDVVAYFDLGSREDGVMGTPEFSAEYKGITFHFADAQNLATFQNDPIKFAPRFGGHCAFAMSRNYFASGDPDAWTVHEDALYLNVSKTIRARWLLRRSANITSGRENWSNYYPGEL